DNRENEVHALDLHLKGSVEVAGRQQDFVVGANYYAVHHQLHWGYASSKAESMLTVGTSNHAQLCSDEAMQQLDDAITNAGNTWQMLVEAFGGAENVPEGFGRSEEDFKAQFVL